MMTRMMRIVHSMVGLRPVDGGAIGVGVAMSAPVELHNV
jgi:hypothetical protein